MVKQWNLEKNLDNLCSQYSQNHRLHLSNQQCQLLPTLQQKWDDCIYQSKTRSNEFIVGHNLYRYHNVFNIHYLIWTIENRTAVFPSPLHSGILLGTHVTKYNLNNTSLYLPTQYLACVNAVI